MRILNLGLDNSILDKNSKLAERAAEYGKLVQEYIVIAPAEKDEETALPGNVKIYGVKSGNKIIGLLKIYKLAKKIIVGKNIDVISVQDQYYLGFVALKLAKKFKLGLEIQVHGFEKYKGPRKIIAKYILPRANSVRVVSRRLKKRMIDEFGVKEGRITIAPIFLEFATRNVEHITRNDGKFVFLTVGRLVPVKNIGMQIEAMAEVIKKYPNAGLWIIGDGIEKEKLKAKSYLPTGQAGKLQANIKLLGWQNDLEKFYNQADAFLLTSHSEGWGLAVVEAASYGLPIIMTDVGCAGEVIKDGESGIVIPISEQRKLEEAMIKLIEDGNFRKKLGEGARGAVKKLLNKEETLNLYKKSWEKALIK